MTTDPNDKMYDGTPDGIPDATSDATDNTPPANEYDEDEEDIPVNIQLQNIICLTPASAVGGLEVDSFAGSGPVIYPDFRTAIRDAWGEFESHFGLDGMPLTDETTPDARAGRQAFKALLARFGRDGYSPDMADELRDLSSEYTPHRVVDVNYVLPEGLDDLLDTAYGRLEEYGEDEEPDEKAKEALASAPPRDQFDLHNPAHLQWLVDQLDYWNYI